MQHTSHYTPTPITADHSPFSEHRASCARTLPPQLPAELSCKTHFQCPLSLKSLFPSRRKLLSPFRHITALPPNVSPAPAGRHVLSCVSPHLPLRTTQGRLQVGHDCSVTLRWPPSLFSTMNVGMMVCYIKHYLSFSEVYKFISKSPGSFCYAPKASNYRNYQG